MPSSESSHTNGGSVNDLLKEVAANARAQLEKERNSIEQSLSNIVDVQVPTLKFGITTYKLMYNIY